MGLKAVKVCFADSTKDYKTNVGDLATFEKCCEYFINSSINLGDCWVDDNHVCTGIIYTNENGVSFQSGRVNL